MPHYSTYSKSSGRVLQHLVCPSSAIDLQLHEPDHDYVDGHIDPDEFMVVARALVRLPPRPSPHHEFDHSARAWVDPRTHQTQWVLVRRERDARLAACDWTQLPDAPATTKPAWAAYRQALRDITEQADPFNLAWPAPPV